MVVCRTAGGRLSPAPVAPVAFVLLFAWSAPAAAAPALNLEQATADTKAKLAAGGRANIVMLGDSLAMDDAFSFRPYFTQRMQALYGDAGPGYRGAYVNSFDYGEDWTSGVIGNLDPAPHMALDGLWVTASGTALPHTAARVTSFHDKIQLHYLARPGGGSADVSVLDTGQPIIRLDSSAPEPIVRSLIYDFPAGVSTSLRVQPAGDGPVTLLGMNLFNETPGVRVHRAANGGWGVDHFLRRDDTFDQQLRLLGTDLVMVAIGANDSARPRDEMVARYNLLVDRLEAAVPCAEIVMVAPYDFGTAGAPMIAGVIEEVAAARGLGLINLYETAGSYEFFRSQGYLADAIHFTPAGGDYVGNIVYEMFRTNGATNPEPAGLLAVAAGMLALMRRPARAVTTPTCRIRQSARPAE